VAAAAYIVLPLLPLCMLASVMSLVMRYWGSGAEVREQNKWIAFAAFFVGLMYLIAMACSLIYPSETWFAAGSPLWLTLLQYAALVSFAAVPIAVGFAVLKYRLYDIDVVINRTLVYGSLTLMLAVVYRSSILVFQEASQAFTGRESQLAIAGSTLAMAALFVTLRRRIQGFIDRRFYRRKYDAATTIEAFSSKLKDETDLSTLSDGLTSLVREMMQPTHVSYVAAPRHTTEENRRTRAASELK
jgi:hypothetical protein